MPTGWSTRGVLALCAMLLAGCARTPQEQGTAPGRLDYEVKAAASRPQGRSGEVVWRVKTDRKVVALTLDDGPDPEYTPRVLKVAREKRVRLTFFLVGREIQLHPDLARREVAEGHAIGNHTWDHETLNAESYRMDIAEIERCEDEIQKVCGQRTHLLRPPKGLWDGETFLVAGDLGYNMILWSVALEHHSARTPEEMASRVISRVAPGVIILAHDGEPGHAINREKTMKALPILIEGLQRKGYGFVTVPELLRLRPGRGIGRSDPRGQDGS